MRGSLHGIMSASLVCLAGCGGGSSSPTSPTNPGTVLLPGNRPPVISGATALPTFGIADLDAFRFEVNATDPDGDRLTYQWDMGLGVTIDGRTATAMYEGGQSTEWVVRVRVTDTTGATASASVSTVVGSVNGLWRIVSGDFAGGELALLQDRNGTVTGNYFLPGAGSLENLSGGQITSAAAVTLPLRLGSRVMTFTGTMDTTGRRIAGVFTGGGPSILVLQ